MIAYLSGKILSKAKNSLVVLTAGGIGYEVKVAPGVFLQAKVGEEIILHTYFNVREDIQELFGMISSEELEFFKILISVNGVGPKSALNFLSLGPVKEVKEGVARGDVNYLTRVSGIGKKIAERIIVELKGKLDTLESKEVGVKGSVWSDVTDALVGMGYSAFDAHEALRGVPVEGKDASTLLKEALKNLRKK